MCKVYRSKSSSRAWTLPTRITGHLSRPKLNNNNQKHSLFRVISRRNIWNSSHRLATLKRPSFRSTWTICRSTTFLICSTVQNTNSRPSSSIKVWHQHRLKAAFRQRACFWARPCSQVIKCSWQLIQTKVPVSSTLYLDQKFSNSTTMTLRGKRFL